MSPRATSPPPRATTPEPALQPLPSPRLRPSRSIGRLSQTTSTSLSSHDEFRLTFDEFGAGDRSSKPPTSPGRTRRRSGPTSPPRRPGSPPPPVHHHPTPPPPLPPLPSFLISVARKSSKGNMSGTLILPSKPFSTSSNESANSRCYPFHRSTN